jgi:hypothetical protein
LTGKIIQFKSSVYYTFLRLGTFLFLPFVFYIFPVTFQDKLGSVCLFKKVTGMECWGCGTRHALYSIMNLEFLDAWNYNKMSFVVFAIFVYLWFKYVINEVKVINNYYQKKHSAYLIN